MSKSRSCNENGKYVTVCGELCKFSGFLCRLWSAMLIMWFLGGLRGGFPPGFKGAEPPSAPAYLGGGVSLLRFYLKKQTP